MATQAAPFIAAETSYLSNDFISSTTTAPTSLPISSIPPPILSKLRNLGPSRARDLRTTHTSHQIVAHLPLDLAPKTYHQLNDALYTALVMNPDRLSALAALPCWDGHEAATELQRCIVKYRFVGGVLGFRRGVWEERAWEKREFDELWKTAERYGVPIALRPLFPTQEQVCVDGWNNGLGVFPQYWD